MADAERSATLGLLRADCSATLWPRQSKRTTLHSAMPARCSSLQTAKVLSAPADDRGAPVPAQLLPASRSTLALQAALAAADALPDPAAAGAHELAFVATLPPMGYVTYALEPCSDAGHLGDVASSGPGAARPLLERPGAGARADTLDAGVCARGGVAAAGSRVMEWAPGRDAVPDLAGVGAGVGRDGRLNVGSGRLALVLDAATGRTVALRAGNAATELSTSAVGAWASERARGQRLCHRAALMRLVHVAHVDSDAASWCMSFSIGAASGMPGQAAPACQHARGPPLSEERALCSSGHTFMFGLCKTFPKVSSIHSSVTHAQMCWQMHRFALVSRTWSCTSCLTAQQGQCCYGQCKVTGLVHLGRCGTTPVTPRGRRPATAGTRPAAHTSSAPTASLAAARPCKCASWRGRCSPRSTRCRLGALAESLGMLAWHSFEGTLHVLFMACKHVLASRFDCSYWSLSQVTETNSPM